MRRTLIVVFLAAFVFVPSAGAWRWPVDGPVLQKFVFGDDPYAAGQHRGIDIGAPSGEGVISPASGTVSFAGTVPVSGKSVTIQTADGYSVALTPAEGKELVAHAGGKLAKDLTLPRLRGAHGWTDGSESGSFGVNLYCSVVAEVTCACLPVLGTPNAARFITIITSAKRYSPIVNPMAACIARIQPSQIQRVLFNQIKMG